MPLKLLASLKLAVFVILGLAGSLATATVLESLYDTPTAQYYVYQATWFYGLLGLLCVCLISVMVDRWPWKKKHIPFLLAHIGIITLLVGSWITAKYGIDGSLRLTEGQTGQAVDLNQPLLVMSEGKETRTIPIPWQPPGTTFRPISLRKLGLPYDVTVDKYLSHAEPSFSFLPNPATGGAPGHHPAVHIKLVGGVMRVQPETWLWTGDASFSVTQAGPAVLELKEAGQAENGRAKTAPPGPKLTLTVEKDGSIDYRSESSSHEVSTGKLAAGSVVGKSIAPNWAGGIHVEITDFVPDALLNTTFSAPRTEYGQNAPPSAIHIAADGDPSARSWLGMGSQVMLSSQGHIVAIGYFHNRILLPFVVRLNRFSMEMYEGGVNPMSYASNVTVPGRGASPASDEDPAQGGTLPR